MNRRQIDARRVCQVSSRYSKRWRSYSRKNREGMSEPTRHGVGELTGDAQCLKYQLFVCIVWHEEKSNDSCKLICKSYFSVGYVYCPWQNELFMKTVLRYIFRFLDLASENFNPRPAGPLDFPPPAGGCSVQFSSVQFYWSNKTYKTKYTV